MENALTGLCELARQLVGAASVTVDVEGDPAATAGVRHPGAEISMPLEGAPRQSVLEVTGLPHAPGEETAGEENLAALRDVATLMVHVLGQEENEEHQLREHRALVHDVRTPLTAVLGFAALLEATATDDRLVEAAGSVCVAGHAVEEALNSTLDEES